MPKSDDKRFAFRSCKQLLDKVCDLPYFTSRDDSPPPIPVHRVDGRSRLVVVVGDNASGKSFFRRVVQGFCAHSKTECIPISAEGRRQVSYNIGLVFVYGDEQHESTGVNSMATILTGISTCEGRKKRHIIFWDEPDLGLSEGWAAGVGKTFAEFAAKMPSKTAAAFIVTHSRALVRELLAAKPNYLHLGVEPSEAPQTLYDWTERPVEPLDPKTLKGMSHERFKGIQAVLDHNKP